MKCPQCGSELQYSDTAYYHMQRYGQPVNVSTICCRKPVRLNPCLVIDATRLKTLETEDDWGTPYETN